ncbi:hypothetical protein PT974_06270 [Cladobotryum mycophilum]|uniref:Uncharacterized protein n=1 Tax=Cladobotryum mycophilum TaxID=491253 RepID=A0ABR0SKZ9_9HYPO
MAYGTVFEFIPCPTMRDEILLLTPFWALYFIVCFCWNVLVEFFPAVYIAHFFCVIVVTDPSPLVQVSSWLSLLALPRPWQLENKDRQIDILLLLDIILVIWFFSALPVLVKSSWIVTRKVQRQLLRPLANRVARRLRGSLEFQLDFPDYMVKCYMPTPPDSQCDIVMAALILDHENRRMQRFEASRSASLMSDAVYAAVFRRRAKSPPVMRVSLSRRLEEQRQSRERKQELKAIIEQLKKKVYAEEPKISKGEGAVICAEEPKVFKGEGIASKVVKAQATAGLAQGSHLTTAAMEPLNASNESTVRVDPQVVDSKDEVSDLLVNPDAEVPIIGYEVPRRNTSDPEDISEDLLSNPPLEVEDSGKCAAGQLPTDVDDDTSGKTMEEPSHITERTQSVIDVHPQVAPTDLVLPSAPEHGTYSDAKPFVLATDDLLPRLLSPAPALDVEMDWTVEEPVADDTIPAPNDNVFDMREMLAALFDTDHDLASGCLYEDSEIEDGQSSIGEMSSDRDFAPQPRFDPAEVSDVLALVNDPFDVNPRPAEGDFIRALVDGMAAIGIYGLDTAQPDNDIAMDLVDPGFGSGVQLEGHGEESFEALRDQVDAVDLDSPTSDVAVDDIPSDDEEEEEASETSSGIDSSDLDEMEGALLGLAPARDRTVAPEAAFVPLSLDGDDTPLFAFPPELLGVSNNINRHNVTDLPLNRLFNLEAAPPHTFRTFEDAAGANVSIADIAVLNFQGAGATEEQAAEELTEAQELPTSSHDDDNDNDNENRVAVPVQERPKLIPRGRRSAPAGTAAAPDNLMAKLMRACSEVDEAAAKEAQVPAAAELAPQEAPAPEPPLFLSGPQGNNQTDENVPELSATPETTQERNVAPTTVGGLILPGGNVFMPRIPAAPPSTLKGTNQTQKIVPEALATSTTEKKADAAPLRMGGLILPGGNTITPTTPAPLPSTSPGTTQTQEKTLEPPATPANKKLANVAPIRMGGLILPGGNTIMPTAPISQPPATPTKKVPDVAPIIMGGLLLPGGNTIMPSTPAPAPFMPIAQRDKTPDAKAIRKQKEANIARDLRSVMAKKKKPVSLFHARKPQAASALIRSPAAAERDREFRTSQRLDIGESPKGIEIISPSTAQAIHRAATTDNDDDDLFGEGSNA